MSVDNNVVLWPGWETVRLIGRGSFGAVYEIQREVRGRTERAALKVISIPQDTSEILDLRSDGYDDESITQYFTDSREKIEDEYAMMADLKGHSNVVYCDDIRTVQHDGSFGWDIYIKMELLTPMKSYLGDGASEAQVIKLGMDICDALKLCEELNIVHRDIKPENIFVSRSGSFKLGDFGIAKTMEGTTGGTKTGTYDYMAPEVYNNRPYHTQADIYSLGLVMYWLLNNRTAPFLPQSGKRPTPSAKTMARDRRFSGDEIPAPLCGSKKLQKIVLKACAFDPKDRYQSAKEMREDLQRLSGAAVPTPVVKRAQNSLAAQKPELPEEATVGPVFNRNTTPVMDEQDKTVRLVFQHHATADVDDIDETIGPRFSVKREKESQSSLRGQTVTQEPVKFKDRKPKCRDKKNLRILSISVLMLLAALLVILICNSQKNKEKASMDADGNHIMSEEPAEENKQTNHTVIVDLAEIEVGQETNVAFLMNEYTYRSDVDLLWESSDPTVASVTKDGKVTGISEGQATITGSLNGLTSSVVITVLPTAQTVPETTSYQAPVQIHSLQVECRTDVILAGDTVEAYATSDSWYFNGDSEGLVWGIDDTSIATVDSKGRVTGKRPGKCHLKVEYQGLSSTMEITVVEVDGKSKVTTELDYERLSLRAGNSDTISMTVSGELPEKCSVLAYYSAGLQLWLKWGETRNPLELTITLEHCTEPEGYVTILVYDEDNPTHIVAAEKVYIKTN